MLDSKTSPGMTLNTIQQKSPLYCCLEHLNHEIRVGAPRKVNGIMWKENYVNMLNRKTWNGKLGNKYPSGQWPQEHF